MPEASVRLKVYTLMTVFSLLLINEMREQIFVKVEE